MSEGSRISALIHRDATHVSAPRATNGQMPPPAAPGGERRDRDVDARGPAVPPVVLATILVIGGEVMFFAGLVFAFWVLRLGAPVWPPPLQPRLPIGVTGVNTLVLLASSGAVVAGARALRRGDRRALVRRLGLAALLGGLFLAVQGYEWARLLGFGLTIASGTYGATFYTLVGAHAAHVLLALLWLGAALALAARGRLTASRLPLLHACAIYWHFVVALWPVLYVSVYLA